MTFSCSNNKTNCDVEIAKLKVELDSLKQLMAESVTENSGEIATFLTFQKENAEQAMNFYVETFDNSKIEDIKR